MAPGQEILPFTVEGGYVYVSLLSIGAHTVIVLEG
jgi:hypothetical protein